MKRLNAFLLTIATTLALVGCNSNLNPPTPATPIILRPEDFVEGEASITLKKLAPDESVAVIPVYATQDFQPERFEYSIRTSNVSPQSVNQVAHTHAQAEPSFHSDHLKFLAESKAIVDDLRRRGVKPIPKDGIRSQSFDKCPPPYTPGKQCRFWVETTSEIKQITATLQRVSKHAFWFVNNDDLSDLSANDLTPLVDSFETISIPINQQYFGIPYDVDQNGKTILVFSSALPRLLGYVRGRDLFPDDPRSQWRSNEADIFYLATPKKAEEIASPGFPIDRTRYFESVMPSTLTHEFKHLISFSYRAQHDLPWEEDWLEEPSAMVAQELAGQGSQVERFQGFAKEALAAPQDFRVTHIQRPSDPADQRSMYGYNFLFLWRIGEQMGHDQFWSSFLKNSYSGVASLETLTGKSFADLLLDWSLTMLFDNIGVLPDHEYLDLNLRDGTWEALGYQSLGNLKGKTRSMAYYLGRGKGADSTITVRTSYSQPHVIVVRFKGGLPW